MLSFCKSSPGGFWGHSLAVQWLRLCASNAGDVSSSPDRGTEILHATLCSQKKKKADLQVSSYACASEHRGPEDGPVPGPTPASWTESESARESRSVVSDPL